VFDKSKCDTVYGKIDSIEWLQNHIPTDTTYTRPEDMHKKRDNLYIPVDPSRPEGAFTVPDMKKCEHSHHLHAFGKETCVRCGYDFTEEKKAKDIESVAEWLKENVAPNWKSADLAKMLIEAGLQPEKLK
jgi:hypothetical protein